MPHRICMLGTSHLAALVLGWKEVRSEFADFDVTFLGAPMDMLDGLALDGGVLRPQSEKLRVMLDRLPECAKEVRVSEFDEFWLVAMGFGPQAIMELYPARWRGNPLLDDDGVAPRAAFTSIACSHLLATRAVRMHRTIRTSTAAPIFIIPRPFPCEIALDVSPGHWFDSWRIAVERGDEAPIAEDIASTYHLVERQGLAVLPQPPYTLASPMFTADAYSRGSVRFSAGFSSAHASIDSGHMNGAFGAAYLRSYLTR